MNLLEDLVLPLGTISLVTLGAISIYLFSSQGQIRSQTRTIADHAVHDGLEERPLLGTGSNGSGRYRLEPRDGKVLITLIDLGGVPCRAAATAFPSEAQDGKKVALTALVVNGQEVRVPPSGTPDEDAVAALCGRERNSLALTVSAR